MSKICQKVVIHGKEGIGKTRFVKGPLIKAPNRKEQSRDFGANITPSLANALAFAEREARYSPSGQRGPSGAMVSVADLAEVMAVIEECDMRLRLPGGSKTFTLRKTAPIGKNILHIAKAMRKARREAGQKLWRGLP